MCETLAEAEGAIEACFSGAFGESGASVVIEEMLVGEECSFFALCDGTRALPLASAQDYKRAFDGDTGLNTGGMGAISPAPMMTPALSDRVMREIIAPTLDEMRERGTPFQGVLYAGLMMTADGPKLIEYNVRFGDPECQVLMPRLKSDLALTLMAAAKGDLSQTEPEWTADVALTVVMAANGYPGDYRKGTVIAGLAEAGKVEGVTVFLAGTVSGSAGETLAAGGRVLNVTAAGKDASEARERAYRAIGVIDWPGGFFQARHRLALAQPDRTAMNPETAVDAALQCARSSRSVVPARARTHGKYMQELRFLLAWIPAFAGMTVLKSVVSLDTSALGPNSTAGVGMTGLPELFPGFENSRVSNARRGNICADGRRRPAACTAARLSANPCDVAPDRAGACQKLHARDCRSARVRLQLCSGR